MIWFYTGVPGSGKSLHVAAEIWKQLKSGKNVIANFNVDTDLIKSKKPVGTFIFEPNHFWLNNAFKHYDNKPPQKWSYLEGLVSYAQKFHERDKRGRIIEHQTLLVLDECQELFNSRSWNRNDRLAWCSFFRQHRKYGFDVILISQDDKNIDKQIRNILDTEVLHRKVSNFKNLGFLISLFCGGKLFVAVYKKYGYKKADAKLDSKFFTGRKYFDFYNSYEVF